MSPALRQFYQDWWDWVQAGAPDGVSFKRDDGLCYALLDWCSKPSRLEWPHCKNLDREITEQFRAARKAGLLKLAGYPFGGDKVFYQERRNRTMHTNPMRLAWVKEQLQ